MAGCTTSVSTRSAEPLAGTRERLLELTRTRGDDRRARRRACVASARELDGEVGELGAAQRAGDRGQAVEARVELGGVRRGRDEKLRVLGGGAKQTLLACQPPSPARARRRLDREVRVDPAEAHRADACA